MNKARRAEIDRASALIDEAKQILEQVSGEEAEALDNLPESFKDGEKGEAMQSCIDALDEAVSTLEGLEYDMMKGEG